MTGPTRRPLAAELLKLATTRAVRWILLAEVLLTALAISGVVASGGVPLGALGTDDGLRTVLAHGGLAAVLSLVLGILISAGEYQHGTIVDTLLTEPRRARVIGTKLGTGAAVGALAGVVGVVTTAITAARWYSAKGVGLDLGSPVVLRSLVGVASWQTLYTMLGVCVGALLRTQAVAIVAVVAWIFIAETAIAGLLVPLGGAASASHRRHPAPARGARGRRPDHEGDRPRGAGGGRPARQPLRWQGRPRGHRPR